MSALRVVEGQRHSLAVRPSLANSALTRRNQIASARRQTTRHPGECEANLECIICPCNAHGSMLCFTPPSTTKIQRPAAQPAQLSLSSSKSYPSPSMPKTPRQNASFLDKFRHHISHGPTRGPTPRRLFARHPSCKLHVGARAPLEKPRLLLRRRLLGRRAQNVVKRRARNHRLRQRSRAPCDAGKVARRWAPKAHVVARRPRAQ